MRTVLLHRAVTKYSSPTFKFSTSEFRVTTHNRNAVVGGFFKVVMNLPRTEMKGRRDVLMSYRPLKILVSIYLWSFEI